MEHRGATYHQKPMNRANVSLGEAPRDTAVAINGSPSLPTPPGDFDADDAKKKSVPAGDSTLPLVQSAALAGTYMIGCITFFLLISYSKSQVKLGLAEKYENNAAVFFTELAKWIFSVAMMWHRCGKFLPVSVFREGSWRVGVYYAVPSAIYAVYNNLTYYNLTNFDAATYQVFMQTRVIFTGVLFSYMMRKHLSQRKWVALIMLTVGVASKYLSWGMHIDSAITVVLFQASLSAFAGVYNEYLLKRDISLDINEQNFFMYSFALFFNLGWGVATNTQYYVGGGIFGSLSQGVFLAIVLNGAVVGIVTSLILKFINVIVKAFASACEVLLTAVLAHWLLGDPLTVKDFIACSIVMASMYWYYTAPATPPPPPPPSDEKAPLTAGEAAKL
jgi:drug/metabolite transporter (DMT)-like permease